MEELQQENKNLRKQLEEVTKHYEELKETHKTKYQYFT